MASSVGMGMGMASTSMSTNQWSLSSRSMVFGAPLHLARKKRIGVTGWSRPVCSVCVRASQKKNNSGDGDNGENGGDVGGSVSRRALVAFLALSVHLGAGASARADNVSEQMRLGMLRNMQQRKSKTSPSGVPPTAVEEPPQSTTLEPVITPSAPIQDAVDKVEKAVTELPRIFEERKAAIVEAVAPEVVAGEVQDKFAQSVPEVISGGNNGLQLLNSVGIIGGGVAGAFYFMEKQAKDQAETAVEASNTKLKDARESMASLRATLEGRLREEKDKAQKASGIAQQQRTKLANELMDTKNSITEIESKLETEKNAAKELQMRIEQLESTLEESKKSLNNRLEEEQLNSNHLQEEIEALKAQNKVKESEISSQNAKLQKEQDTVTTLQAHIKTLDSELAVERERISSLRSEYELLQDAKAVLEVSLEKLGVHLKSTNEAKAKLEGEMLSVNEALNNVRHLLEEEQRKKEKLGVELKKTSDALEKATTEAELLQQQLAEISAAKVTLENDMKVKISDMAVAKDRLEKQMEGKITELSAAKDALAKELEDKIEQLTEMSAAKDAHEKDLDGKIKQLTEMSVAKETLRKEKEGEIRKLSVEIQEKSEKIDNLVSTNQSLSNDIASWKNENEALSMELRKTHNELEASTEEIKTISKQLTDAVNLSLKLEKQLNEARASYQSMSAYLAEERKVTAAAKNQLAMSQKSLLAEKNSVKALRGSVDQALQALQELNRDSVAIAEELERAKKRISSLEVESLSLQQKLAKEKELSAGYQAGAKQAELTIAKIVKENDAANKKVKHLEGELLKNKAELVRHKGKIVETKRALQLAESRLETLPQVRAEAALLVEKYEDLAFQEREQKETLMRQNEELLKLEKKTGTNLTGVKKSLEDGQAARSEMEAVLGSLQEAVADTPTRSKKSS